MKQTYYYMFMNFIMVILVIISVLICVAFLTLLERKILGYIQMRKGPNKVGVIGLIQPFSDAIKLMSKEIIYMYKSNFIFFLMSPMFMLILILMMWMIYPIWVNYISMKLGLLYLMCCFSMGAYGLFMSGWASNSVFSMLGSMRSLAQSISYEVSLSLIFIIPMMMVNSFNFESLNYMQNLGNWLVIFMFPLSVMFLFSIMAELNRTPFDFSEGESELVSGFNIEYSSVGFVMIFLSEYASILLMSMLYSLIFMGGIYSTLFFYLEIMCVSIFIIWIRGTFPRFRYDLLMYLCWMMILPISLNYLFFMIIFKIYLFKKKDNSMFKILYYVFKTYT